MDVILRDHLVALGYRFSVRRYEWAIRYKSSGILYGGHNKAVVTSPGYRWGVALSAALEHAVANGVRL